MAIEDQKYDDLVKHINALLATGRTTTARTCLIKLALDILKYYGYEVKIVDEA
jgi:hypothetical protein